MGPRVVVFAGEYDIASQALLRAEFDALVPVRHVILDFSRVTYMDSTAITELVRMHKLRAENLFERETIVINGGTVQKVFDLLELRKMFSLVGSLEEAMHMGGEAITHYAAPGGRY